MSYLNLKPAQCADCRKVFLQAITIYVFLLVVCAGAVPVHAIELDHPSSVVQTDEALPHLSTPSPVPANADTCLALLKSARYTNTSAMDRNRRSAGKAAAVGLVLGFRFALGPKEINKPSQSKSPVRFDVWQPRDVSGAQALAVADYRRCKNEKALNAISDWRWKR